MKKAIQRSESEVDRLEKEKSELALALSNPAEGANIASLGRKRPAGHLLAGTPRNG